MCIRDSPWAKRAWIKKVSYTNECHKIINLRKDERKLDCDDRATLFQMDIVVMMHYECFCSFFLESLDKGHTNLEESKEVAEEEEIKEEGKLEGRGEKKKKKMRVPSSVLLGLVALLSLAAEFSQATELGQEKEEGKQQQDQQQHEHRDKGEHQRRGFSNIILMLFLR